MSAEVESGALVLVGTAPSPRGGTAAPRDGQIFVTQLGLIFWVLRGTSLFPLE